MRLRLLVFETQRIAGLEAGILLLTEFPLFGTLLFNFFNELIDSMTVEM